MKFLSQMCLLAIAAIAVCFVGCSRSESKTDKGNIEALEQTREDAAFAKANGAAWITMNCPPIQPTLTVDLQEGAFSKGSTHACELWVDDVQKENDVLLLTGFGWPTFNADFEIEITTNMLSRIRTAGGKFSFVRIAFQVESLKRSENESSEDSSDRYLIRGKAMAVEAIPRLLPKEPNSAPTAT